MISIRENTKKSGFSILELLISLAIMIVLAVIVFSTFINFRKNESLVMDSETIVSVLRQARNQTLTSKNSSSYGVHITASKITLFTGTSYVSGGAGNQDFVLSTTDTILTINLTGGGSDVVFQRLTGETSQNGTVAVSSPGINLTKTVTIYKTGLIEAQ